TLLFWDLRRLGDLFRNFRFHSAHIEIEQAFALVPLVLVLFPEFYDLPEDFYIESLGLGLGKHFLLLLVQFLQFGVQVLDALNEGTDPPAGNGDVRHGTSLLNEIMKMTAKR